MRGAACRHNFRIKNQGCVNTSTISKGKRPFAAVQLSGMVYDLHVWGPGGQSRKTQKHSETKKVRGGEWTFQNKIECWKKEKKKQWLPESYVEEEKHDQVEHRLSGQRAFLYVTLSCFYQEWALTSWHSKLRTRVTMSTCVGLLSLWGNHFDSDDNYTWARQREGTWGMSMSLTQLCCRSKISLLKYFKGFKK